MKHVKLFEDFTNPTNIEDEVASVLKKINANDKALEFSFEPSEKGKPKVLSTFDDHERDGNAVERELFIHYTDASGVKKDINVEYTFSYTVYAGRKGDGYLQPDDPDEVTLEDLEVTSFGVTDDEGDVIKCEFSPEIHYELLDLLQSATGCDEISRSFSNELKKLKALI